MGVEGGGFERGAGGGAGLEDGDHGLLQAVHGVEDPVLAGGTEIIEVVDESVAVLFAVCECVSAWTAAKLAFGTVSVKVAALDRRVDAR